MERSGTARLNEDRSAARSRVNRPTVADPGQRSHVAGDPTSRSLPISAGQGERSVPLARGQSARQRGYAPNFFDGDDPDQLAWALKQNANAKLILVKGAPLELMKAGQRRFYFDQGGKLTERFGIRSVPARVRQQGRLLEVSEIALPPKRRAAQ